MTQSRSVIGRFASVAGVATAGSFIFKREGEPEKVIKTGEPFFEAAGVTTS